MVTAVKVRHTGGDWEGIYVENELQYENHTATLEDVLFQDTELPEIGGITVQTVDLQTLGRTSLPQLLSHLDFLRGFERSMVENFESWETSIREALQSLKTEIEDDDADVEYLWPTREELASELGVNIKDGEFNVLSGVFTPASISNNKTAHGNEAVFSFVSTGANEDTRYAPIESPDSVSYE